MAFVVNGAEWCFEDWPVSKVVDAIDNLLDRVSTAYDRGETVWIGDDLQTRPVLGESDLWSLCSPDTPINLPAELWQELTAWLGAARRYADEEIWPAGLTETLIQVDSDLAVENADLAWAHHNVRAGHGVACLTLTRSCQIKTVSSQGSAVVHCVQNEMAHRAFWRAALDVEGDNEATLERLVPHAFPDLYFYDGVLHGLNRLVGGYLALRIMIRNYLSILDDHGSWAFKFPPPALSPGEPVGPNPLALPSNQIIERRFQGLGIDMAPENPNVYANGDCRRAREITIGTQTFYCGWHGKLEPHQNRLHVHPPVQESDGKVIIAIFHEHLPLPGD